MSSDPHRSPGERHFRSPKPRDRGISDERDEDSEQVAPPAKLIALFVVPLLLLIVWAMSQS